MVSEDSEPTDVVPTITPLQQEALDNIRATLGLNAGDVPPDNLLPPDPVVPKRRRGRPRKHPISETGTTVPELAAEEAARTGTPLPPAKLGRRDEKEVSERITNMFMGATGIASQAKPYLAMTEEEAKAIADPLSSYLVRNAETIPVAQQILENYDLLAIVLGVLAYTVRIYRDRAEELAEQRANNQPANGLPSESFIDRITQSANSAESGQEERSNGFVSAPYG